MFSQGKRYGLLFRCAMVVALLAPFAAQAQRPAASSSHSSAAALMKKDVVDMAGKEVTVSTVTYPPGVSSKPHRHDAQTFVYVLEGTVKMQVRGGPVLTLGPGQTFYEGPDDIHQVSANASSTEPAKILVFMIKDKSKPSTRFVSPQDP